MRRILFVDPGKEDLPDPETIKNNFNDDWDTHLVSTGKEAQDAFESTEYDVIVSEMVLPDSTGPELMKSICTSSPGALRIIVSSESNRELVLQAANSAHRFISKPFQPDTLCKTIENSISLRELLSNEDLHKRIATIDHLPSPPEVYDALVKELGSDDSSVRKVAEIVKKDVAITAKILQIANSAYFGLPTHIESILHAVNFLGLDTIKSLVLAAGVFDRFKDPGLPEFSFDEIYNRSLLIGASSRHIANAFGLQARLTDDAFMAGMLHDVGKLVMLINFQDELKQSFEIAAKEDIPLYEAQRRILGVSDAEIGAHLLSLWGLPDTILEAVALHYTPHKAPSPILNVLTAVHLAFAIEHDQSNKIRDENKSAIDLPYVEQLGLINELPNLRNFCTAALV